MQISSWFEVLGQADVLRLVPGGRRILRTLEKRALHSVYRWADECPALAEAKARILSITPAHLNDLDVRVRAERALPGDSEFLSSGYSRSMFGRYFLAARIASGQPVLDTCSGLGWGAYLLNVAGSSVCCLDMDSGAIALARRLWPQSSADFIEANALALPFADATWPIVCAMESLEHFHEGDGILYVKEIRRVLNAGGWLIGSTPLAATQSDVQWEKSNNPFHLHVHTRNSLRALLNAYFHRAYVFESERFFVARK